MSSDMTKDVREARSLLDAILKAEDDFKSGRAQELYESADRDAQQIMFVLATGMLVGLRATVKAFGEAVGPYMGGMRG